MELESNPLLTNCFMIWAAAAAAAAAAVTTGSLWELVAVTSKVGR